ncbi:MAG: hypothetical protein NXY57DRAFT_727972 [Lentinula lateritia]|uniref:Uncharacterized protein n=1 Tax=Lentinula lateritia TaxID=40482 RepID=A0ABQ8VDT6_9AGAR|nr:MAG: hypothetical protein NXY57DRAFT_727972 [Lentinula lateritia]KAJ4489230.1 hypothetical protein C8R41DRAFT_920659 [Lentinula lateritia]
MRLNFVCLVLVLASAAYAGPISNGLCAWFRSKSMPYSFSAHSGHLDSGNANYQVLLEKDKIAKELVQKLFEIGAHVNTFTEQSFIGATTDITRGFDFEVGQNVIRKQDSGPYHGWVKANINFVGDKMVIDENSIGGYLKAAGGKFIFQVGGGKATQEVVLRCS